MTSQKLPQSNPLDRIQREQLARRIFAKRQPERRIHLIRRHRQIEAGRTRMGAAGRKFVEKYYIWSENARSMEEIYRAALSRERPEGVPIYSPDATPSFQVD